MIPDLRAVSRRLPLLLFCVVSVSPAEDPGPPAETELAESALRDIDLLDMAVPVVVTASRHAERITQVPAAISVITAEDIRRSGARSVPDALRLVPGVDVADLSYSNYAVAPRGFHGFGSRQTLILVDGRQLFDAMFGGTVWGSWPFALEDIERIEVIRGPAGVAWGANAVNGVINIITRRPEPGESFTSVSGAGSRGVARQYLSYSWGDEKLALRVSGEYERSDGFRRRAMPMIPMDDGLDAGSANLFMTYQVSERDQLTFSAGSKVATDGLPRTPQVFPGPASSESNFVLGKWTRNLDDDEQVELTLFANDFHLTPGGKQIDYRYQQVALQFSHAFRPHRDHLLTWGVDTRLDLLDTSHANPILARRPHIESGIVGLYARDEWRFARDWTLQVGGRISYDTYGGWAPSARLALQYEIDERSSVFVSGSRAIQMSPSGLRFPDLPVAKGLGRIRGNQSVPPQELLAYEIGYRVQPTDDVQLSANVFWNDHDEMTTLAARPGPPALFVLYEDTRATARMYGAELEASWQVTDELKLLGHYTYQHLDWGAGGGIHQKDLISPPQHKFMVGTRWSPDEDLHLAAHLYYTDNVDTVNPLLPFVTLDVEDYFRLDLHAEYEFWEDQAAVSVGVKNLLDGDHLEGSSSFLSAAEVPRLIYAQLRIAIK